MNGVRKPKSWRIFLFNWLLFKLHVNFPKCIVWIFPVRPMPMISNKFPSRKHVIVRWWLFVIQPSNFPNILITLNYHQKKNGWTEHLHQMQMAMFPTSPKRGHTDIHNSKSWGIGEVLHVPSPSFPFIPCEVWLLYPLKHLTRRLLRMPFHTDPHKVCLKDGGSYLDAKRLRLGVGWHLGLHWVPNNSPWNWGFLGAKSLLHIS